MTTEKNVQKRSKKKLKIALIIIASILAVSIITAPLLLIGTAVCVLNATKTSIYPDYYAIKTDICQNPGLYDGFVCQNIVSYEEPNSTDKFLISGYMNNGSAGRIYVTDLDNNSHYVNVILPDGKDFTGHAGGLTLHGESVYLASDSSLFVLSLEEILNAEKGDDITVQKIIPVNNASSFAFADDEYLFVGEFHDGVHYITENYYQTPNGDENHAIVSIYSYEALDEYQDGDEDPIPLRIYSIQNKVQGFCVTDDGKAVMSTSYGLADSFYYVYDMDSAELMETTEDGVPVFYFAGEFTEMKGPAMAEGLDCYEGKVITLSESASNKYIFGKFFFADKIVALDFDKLD